MRVPNETMAIGRERRRAEQQRSLDTRAALLGVARTMFGEAGYHATGTTDVVARAQVTRGALYHHFRSKEALFEAVCRDAEQELTTEAQGATLEMEGRTLPRALASLRIYLSLLATRRDIQRILLLDGPAVLGWQKWKTLRSDFEYAGWVRTLTMLTDQGQMDSGPIPALAQIIMAAVDETTLAVAHADDPEATLAEMSEALTIMIVGIVRVEH